jgi:hypothetical protein
MSIAGQVFLGLGIVAAGVALFILVGEVSVWFAMRHWRSEPPEEQRQIRRRLRRAFWWRWR